MPQRSLIIELSDVKSVLSQYLNSDVCDIVFTFTQDLCHTCAICQERWFIIYKNINPKIYVY